jgi:hypothetical protein
MDPVVYSTHALKFLQDGLTDIGRVMARSNLDPVPPPAAVTAALQAAQAQLSVLKALFEGSAVPGVAAAAAAAGTAAVAAGQPSSASLPDVLKAVGPDDAKLRVLLGLLLAGAGSSRQPLQQTVLPQGLQPLLDAAAELLAPVLTAASSLPAASEPGNAFGGWQDVVCLNQQHANKPVPHMYTSTTIVDERLCCCCCCRSASVE